MVKLSEVFSFLVDVKNVKSNLVLVVMLFSYSNLKVSNDWPQGYDHFSLGRARGLAGEKVNDTAHSNTFQNKTPNR